jgi:hypothetical protein
MTYADIHYGKHFRSFIQLKSGIETFRQGGPRPIDEKRLTLKRVSWISVPERTEMDRIQSRSARVELRFRPSGVHSAGTKRPAEL